MSLPSRFLDAVGRSRIGSHVHRVPVDGVGAQLFPCNLVFEYAADLPRDLRFSGYYTLAKSLAYQRALLTGPDPPGFEPVGC